MFCRFATTAVLAVMLLSILTVAATANDHPLTTQSLSQMPLAFTKNMGQWDDRVLFRASSGGATMWFTKEGVTYEFTRRIDKLGGSVAATGLDSPIRGKDSKPDSTEQLVLSAKFLGGNPNPEVVAEGQMEYKCNFFLGNEPTKWHTDVPNYESIVLKDVYTGIDVRYSDGGSGQAAYEFVVAPGADMSQIKVTYEGVEGTSIDADGRMVVTTKWGDMIAALESPANGVLSGTGSFSQLSGKTIGFEAEGATGQALGTQTVIRKKTYNLGGFCYDYQKNS